MVLKEREVEDCDQVSNFKGERRLKKKGGSLNKKGLVGITTVEPLAYRDDKIENNDARRRK